MAGRVGGAKMRAFDVLLVLSVSWGGLAVVVPACGGDSTGISQSVNCPAVPPNNQSACDAAGTACTYGNVACDCSNAAAPVWTCTQCPACPATRPTGACMARGGPCAALPPCLYGAVQCTCPAGGPAGGMWVCGSCPAAQPAAMSACPTQALACDYGATTCTCRRMGGNDVWECITPPPGCPSAQPPPGLSCIAGTGGLAGCTYGATTCRCLGSVGDAGNEWSCN
jgi:hypothetical protein